MPISSNRRQRVIEFATPKVADLVVVERVDCSKNVSSAAVADDTAYGTPHPDATKFPYFKLALIKNGDDEQGQFQDWYYVKDRDKQDDYNWEYQAAGANTPHYDTVVRTYVTLRTAFDPHSPEITDDMTLLIGEADASSPFAEDYILFEKKQTRSGDEFLDTLYVVEQHVYVRRVPMSRVDVDPEFPAHDALRSKETLWYIGETPTATRKFDEDPDEDTGLDTISLFADSEAEIDVHDDFQVEGEDNPKTNFWGVDRHGILREGKQLSDNWYAIMEKEVVGGVGLLATYETYQTFAWPAVLDGDAEPNPASNRPARSGGGEGYDGGIMEGGILVHSWARRTGGADTVATPIFKHQGWSGPTRMKIERFWQKGAFPSGSISADDARDNAIADTIAAGGSPTAAITAGETASAAAAGGSDTELARVKPMLPRPINFVTPIFTLKVSSCLHNALSVWATSGTEHEVYKYVGSSFTFRVTNYNDWPDSHVVSDTQTTFRGGYLRERTTAYSPA